MGAAPSTGGPDLVADFAERGFVLLPRAVDEATVAELTEAVTCAPERGGEQVNPLSLDAMRFRSNLFYGSRVLQRFLSSPFVTGLLGALVGPDVWVRWDQAVWKGPGAPEFPWHQDNGYTELGAEHLQLWLALTPMDRSNGGLLVVPGGHTAPLPHHWVGHHVQTDPGGPELAIDAEAGDVVAFSSFLPHSTGRNVTGTSRLAYVAEFLPTSIPDLSVPPPHLVVLEGGRACHRWLPEGFQPGATPPAHGPTSA